MFLDDGDCGFAHFLAEGAFLEGVCGLGGVELPLGEVLVEHAGQILLHGVDFVHKKSVN